MKRASTGKRLELSPRDVEIFRALSRYRYLRSTYLHAFVGGASKTRFKERLGDLFHEGYLDRPAEQWRVANSRYVPVVHELGKGARQVLSNVGIEIDDQRTWLRDAPHRQFEHSLMICEILASIELGTLVRPDLRFIPWPEIIAKAPASAQERAIPFGMTAALPQTAEKAVVVPDAVFGLEYRHDHRKFYRFFALETDRGTMPLARSNRHQTSYLGKIAAYRGIFDRQAYKTELGLPNLLVLTVTTSERRKSEIVRRIKKQSGTQAVFLFKAVSETIEPSLQLACDPWERAGHAALSIGTL